MGAVTESLGTLSACGYDLRCVPASRTEDPSTRGRVLVVDQHELAAVGLQLALAGRRWSVETTTGPTAHDIVDHARRFEPQCVLLDIHLGDEIGSGIDLIGPLVQTDAQVVILTAERRRAVLAECLEAGAAGWISKHAALGEVDSTLGRLLDRETVIGRTDRAALLGELRAVRDSERRTRAIFDQLTQREALVLAALTDGLSADEIAQAHFVALATVRSQIRGVLQKLGVRSQLAAVALAADHRDLLPRREQPERERRRAFPRDQGCGPDRSLHIA